MKRLLTLFGAGVLAGGMFIAGAPAAFAHDSGHWKSDREYGSHDRRDDGDHRDHHDSDHDSHDSDHHNHNHNHHGHDFRNVTVVREGESIQEAIDGTEDGGTVLVKDGTYHEQLVITHPVKLLSRGATLAPPETPGPASPCSMGESNGDGICIAGEFTATDTGVDVTKYLEGVMIAGLKVSGFEGSGIVQLGGKGTTFFANTATDNGEYGIAAFSSNGTKFAFNRATGSDEAGFYVGDSHPADATLFGNRANDNGFGIFVRNAEEGTIRGNRVTGNCLGILFLADAPGPDGAFRVEHNLINDNSKACPASEEGPPISGIGVAILGAHDVSLRHNEINDNVASGPSEVSGGVVVASGDGGTAPVDNVIRRNEIRDNNPDLVWDGTGTGNVFAKNECQTSLPPDLCGAGV